MPPFVGVTAYTAFDASSAKRDLLFFDQLAIPGLPDLLDELVRDKEGDDRATLADIEWLQTRGLVTEATLTVDRDTAKMLLAAEQDLDGAPNIFTRLVAQHLRETKSIESVALEVSTPLEARRYRITQHAMRDEYVIQARCILPTFDAKGIDAPKIWHRLSGWPFGEPTKKEVEPLQAFRVILQAFPEPDESTSWEQILEFKQSAENQRHRLALRRWITQVATKLGDAIEIAKELEHLQIEYEAHMHLHEMKTQKGSIETTIVGSATLLEDLVKFKWGEAAKLLFSIQHQHMALLEAEAEAPGREISYLIKATQAFGPRTNTATP